MSAVKNDAPFLLDELCPEFVGCGGADAGPLYSISLSVTRDITANPNPITVMVNLAKDG
jgi:hypothetical protein